MDGPGGYLSPIMSVSLSMSMSKSNSSGSNCDNNSNNNKHTNTNGSVIKKSSSNVMSIKNNDSALSFTTVGQRHLRKIKMKKTVDHVLEDLKQDSKFFQDNPPRIIASFDHHEVKSGAELGRGEFGVVVEVLQLQKGSVDTATDLAPPNSILILPENSIYSSSHDNDNHHSQLSFSKLETDTEQTSRTRQISVLAFSDEHHFDRHSTTTEDEDDEEFEEGEEEQGEGVEIHGDTVPVDSAHPDDLTTSPASIARDLRLRLARKVLRNGQPRYALKRLMLDNFQDQQQLQNPRVHLIPQITELDAALDLACEARFLQCISHTNIIRLRGVVGEPGTKSFGLLLDRLTRTLVQQIQNWRTEYRSSHKPAALLFRRKQLKEREQTLYAERILVALDVARALKHLHSKSILYRDLKPDNIGFNVRGDVQIFDFGLAKELKPKDRVPEHPDAYEATGLTGSRRYMAPEVIRCLPYGFSADVYSFAILMWQIFSLDVPFPSYDANKHFEHVVEGRKRPRKLSILSSMMQRMMENGWADNPSQRPTFQQICTQLKAEFCEVNRGGDVNQAIVMDRSMFLSDQSYNSFNNSSDQD